MRELRADIRESRARLAAAEKLLAAAEDGITLPLLCRCVNRLGLYWIVERVLGLPPHLALSGEQRRLRILGVLLSGNSESAAIEERKAATTVAWDKAAPATAVLVDVVSQATAIARSARGEIDWTREPLTEREAVIRQHWLARRLENELGRIQLECFASSLRYKNDGISEALASDIEQALAKSGELSRADRAHSDADEIADIIGELDDER